MASTREPVMQGGSTVPRFATGCAGWSIQAAQATRFPGTGTHLARYARVLPVVEVDSSFHRRHLAETWARWAASVPDGFRFSVKTPRERLADAFAPVHLVVLTPDEPVR